MNSGHSSLGKYSKSWWRNIPKMKKQKYRTTL